MRFAEGARFALYALAATAVAAVAWTMLVRPPFPDKRSVKRPQNGPMITSRAPIIDPTAIRKAALRHPLVSEGLRPGARGFLDGRWPSQSNIRLVAPAGPMAPANTRAPTLPWRTLESVPTGWETP